MKRIAGIVLYNPEVDRLKENMAAIMPQVDELLLVENGSHDASFLNQFEGIEKVVIIRNNASKGIAYALNQILEYAYSRGYEWALTLDQDSVCPNNLIAEYEKYVGFDLVGMICPLISDRNVGQLEWSGEREYDIVDACITSASLVNVNAWRLVGGFWNELFIDMVDFDICWSLKEHGFRIIRVNNVLLSHEVGNGKKVHFRGKDVGVYNHSPLRDYYIIRNSIAVGRRHHRLGQCARWCLKRVYLINRYESKLFTKNLYMIKGVFHGLIGRLGEYKDKS